MPKKAHWYKDAFRWIAILSGAGVLGIAVTVGIYIKTIQNHDADIAALKASQSFYDLKERVAVLEARVGNNAPAPALPITRSTAGKQR